MMSKYEHYILVLLKNAALTHYSFENNAPFLLNCERAPSSETDSMTLIYAR